VRFARGLAAAASLLLLSGCDLNFWRMDGHQSTMVVEGQVAREQLHVFYVTVWVTMIIFVIVGSVLAYGEIRPRKVNKPVTGQFAAAGVNPRRHLAELRLDD